MHGTWCADYLKHQLLRILNTMVMVHGTWCAASGKNLSSWNFNKLKCADSNIHVWEAAFLRNHLPWNYLHLLCLSLFSSHGGFNSGTIYEGPRNGENTCILCEYMVKKMTFLKFLQLLKHILRVFPDKFTLPLSPSCAFVMCVGSERLLLWWWTMLLYKCTTHGCSRKVLQVNGKEWRNGCLFSSTAKSI